MRKNFESNDSQTNNFLSEEHFCYKNLIFVKVNYLNKKKN